MTVLTPKRMLDVDEVVCFVTCEKSHNGSATFTLVSSKSGKRFTYKAAPPKKEREGAKGRTLFVSLLTGSDNTNDFSYMGTLWQPEEGRPWFFRHTKASKVGPEAPSSKAFAKLWTEAMKPAQRRPPNLLDVIEVWHEGRCGRCGRLLTDPIYIDLGFGRDCLEKMPTRDSGTGAAR